MFDMSWGEIMVIGGVALIVIGPKDLPKALRTLGQMTTKVRRMAGEFQSQFSEAMREAELEDVRKEVDGLNREVSSATAGSFNPIQTIRDEIKGAVESRSPSPAPAVASGDWTAGQSELTLAPVAEAGSFPPLETRPLPGELGPLISAEQAGSTDMLPEVQPLRPLPVDEPVLPTPEPVALGSIPAAPSFPVDPAKGHPA